MKTNNRYLYVLFLALGSFVWIAFVFIPMREGAWYSSDPRVKMWIIAATAIHGALIWRTIWLFVMYKAVGTGLVKRFGANIPSGLLILTAGALFYASDALAGTSSGDWCDKYVWLGGVVVFGILFIIVFLDRIFNAPEDKKQKNKPL